MIVPEWVLPTPLGLPVLPEVKITYAKSLGKSRLRLSCSLIGVSEKLFKTSFKLTSSIKTRSGKPNAFAYFTQIIWFAFLRRITKEKKQQEVKQKMIANYGIEQMMDSMEGDDTQYQSQMLDFLRRNSREELPEDKKKETKK